MAANSSMRGRNGGTGDHDDAPLLAETAAPELRPPAPGSPLWSRMTHPRKGPNWLRALLAVAIVTLSAYLLAVRVRRQPSTLCCHRHACLLQPTEHTCLCLTLPCQHTILALSLPDNPDMRQSRAHARRSPQNATRVITILPESKP